MCREDERTPRAVGREPPVRVRRSRHEMPVVLVPLYAAETPQHAVELAVGREIVLVPHLGQIVVQSDDCVYEGLGHLVICAFTIRKLYIFLSFSLHSLPKDLFLIQRRYCIQHCSK